MASMLKKDVAGSFALAMYQRFREVEALGLPSLKEERRVQLNDIYVPLRLTWDYNKRREPDSAVYVPEALEKQKHMVVLGDPGSGKSTLVSVLTYGFGRAGSTPFKRLLGELLPIPVILRDYKVRRWNSYDDLLRDFVNSNLVQDSIDDAIRADITPEFMLAQLRDGNAILMLDGLDEVGSREDRLHLRDHVVFPLLEVCARSLVVLTSRIVGYDEVTFERRLVGTWENSQGDLTARMSKVAERCYVAPFTDEDIEQFITRWYQAREPFPDKQREGIESLKLALSRNDRVRRLAENPSLLTLIALIHRKTTNLPSGRVNLYDKIVEAYLETIQTYRKLSVPAPLDEMKRWLARVGWEMQNRRDQSDEEDLLVQRGEVLQWLTEAIQEKRTDGSAQQDAEAFLEYVARRSGLLIPRGPDEFAFVHLTFQEYFAAFTLRGKVRRFDTLVRECQGRLPLHYWHETLGVLFEMLTEFEGACDDLFDELRQSAAMSNDEEQAVAAEFFSELLLDEQNGLSSDNITVAAEFVLTELCREFNGDIIKNLKNLPPLEFARLVESWFSRQLQTMLPYRFGLDFFCAGNELLEDWAQRLAQWVIEKPEQKLNDIQVALVTLFAANYSVAYQQVASWAVEHLSLLRWLAPINHDHSPYYQGYGALNLVDVYQREVAMLPKHSVRQQLLLEFYSLSVTQKEQILRLTIALFDYEVVRPFFHAGSFEVALNRVIAYSYNVVLAANTVMHVRKPAMALAYAFSVSRTLARGYRQAIPVDHNFDYFLSHVRARMLARPLATAITPFPSTAQNLPSTAQVEWLLFAPETPPNEYQDTITRTQQLTSAADDWTRLQGVTSLLSLGAGSPELLATQNTLIAKGVKQPAAFTFPVALHSETETPEFRAQLPDLFKLIFLHDPDDPETHWLQPEFFDPSQPVSKYFLSNPREFFILAADALDPNGETELGQWRRKIKDEG